MRIISEPSVGRADRAMGWPSQIHGLIRVLTGTLLLALFHHPTPAQSATPPPTYSVTVAWDPNPEPTVIGYRAYYGVASRVYTNIVDVGNTTSVTLSGLAEGTRYYFAITAYDILGLESDFSDELSYLPGIPTVRTRVMSDGQAVLTLKGRIDHAYDIEATEDFATWAAIGTVTMGANGSSEFTDPNAASFPKRFYRTRDTEP